MIAVKFSQPTVAINQHALCNDVHYVFIYCGILYLYSVYETLTMKRGSGCCSLSPVHAVFLLVALVNSWVSIDIHLCFIL